MPAADSYKHKKSSRVLIPSHEEAGAEDASPKVARSPIKAEIPKNPVVRRGQDPELFWLGKYGADDTDGTLRTDIRSLYRHEHIAPEKIITGLYRFAEGDRFKEEQMELGFDVAEAFGNAITRDDLEKVSDYYTHSAGWTNRPAKSSASTSIPPTASNTAPTGKSN